MRTDEVTRLMHEVAEQAIRPRFRTLCTQEIIEKKPGDLVTAADHEAEELLTVALRQAAPGALVVGEEACFGNPALLEGLAQADHAFVVDPVDGTRNFVQGSPDHAVMIAELRQGVTTRAWIHQPEHGVDWVGERGAGVTRNGQTLTRPTASYPLRGNASAGRLIGRAGQQVAPIERTAWCCGIDYPLVLAGERAFVTYLHTNPWDHLPGALMLSELGGVVRLADRTPYDAACPADGTPGLLAAISPEAWDAAAAVVFGTAASQTEVIGGHRSAT